uniref:FBA_2 domain-containing protein n=1 Tax=Steinernema glaseri TaxID=37863 RepID=A0A1I8A3Q8_9BILA
MYDGIDFENEWQKIDADDELMELIMRLQVPEKKLAIWGRYFDIPQEQASRFLKTIMKNSCHLRTFTNLNMCSADTTELTRLVETMMSLGGLRDILMMNPMEVKNSSSWVDFFFSDSCRYFSGDIMSYRKPRTSRKNKFKEYNIVFDFIDRWKEMDPRRLAPKTLQGVEVPYALHVGMKRIPVHSVSDQELRNRIIDMNCVALHRMDHPTDPSSTIYMILRWKQEGYTLLFV